MSFYNHCCQSFSFRLSAFFSVLYVVLSFIELDNYSNGGFIGKPLISRGYWDTFTDVFRVFIEALVIISPFWIISLFICAYSFRRIRIVSQ